MENELDIIAKEVGIKRDKESDNFFKEIIMTIIDDMDDNKWEELSKDTQNWYNTQSTLQNEEEPKVEPSKEEESPEARLGKALEEAESVEESPEEKEKVVTKSKGKKQQKIDGMSLCAFIRKHVSDGKSVKDIQGILDEKKVTYSISTVRTQYYTAKKKEKADE